MSGAVPAQLADLPVEQAAPTSRFAGQAKLFPWLLFGPTILYLVLMSIFPCLFARGQLVRLHPRRRRDLHRVAELS